MSKPKVNESAPKTHTVVWVTYDRDGFKLHVSECLEKDLKASQVKEFLPDLKPIVMGKADFLLEDLMDAARSDAHPKE